MDENSETKKFYTFARKNLRNLVCTLLIWTITSVSYFLLEFELKYLKGGIFRDASASSLAEITGCIIGGFLLIGHPSKMRIRLTLVGVYSFMLVGAVSVWLCDRHG